MRLIRATIGGFIAAVVINGSWRVFTERLGPLGGIVAAIILVGTMWFLNHYIGLIPNEKNCAFIDMGIAVGIACIVRDIINLRSSEEILSSIPTLALVIIGGIIGGILSVFIKIDMIKGKCIIKNNKEV